ncbi:response regulator transcription factor [Actinoplanes sp. TBRC 11911]|uniref:response regulator transcription factor n=1 Tax=Actinoplanes sp. TBRC 11911 TaxID=2729386 RepID=UPI00145D8A56|nr:response regulator transcription factor [Actinoplanes sp. TBRC 11911]NMO52421.1 response regulator transcription factor [Actinoplanes sp. TBRC 11911]
MTNATVPLALVSDNAIVRSGLAHVLASAPGVRVGGWVDSITALPADDPPALLVLDLYAQRAARLAPDFWELRPPDSRIIALCRPDAPPNLPVALRGGVRALLTRESSAAELLAAVQTVRHGGLHVGAELLGALLSQIAPEPRKRERELTAREVETLRWLASGLTQAQIGARMGLADGTVSTYVKRLRLKLEAGTKPELIRRGIELGHLSA